MYLNDIRVCSHCDTVIDDGDKVYIRDGEIIGCEHCIDEDIIHIVTPEELEEEYRESLYEEERINRFFDL